MLFTSAFSLIALALGAIAAPTLPDSHFANDTLLTQRSTSYTNCNIGGKVVALTFDDGPYKYNEQLVNYLNSEGVKATFFMNGNNYDCIYSSPYPTYIKHLVASGHQIGSHTWDHPDLQSLSNSKVTSELVRINEALVYITGKKPRYFRPPYGDIDSRIDGLVKAQGQIPVTWTFDSGDSTGSTVAQSEAAYAKEIKAGKKFIALNHETYSTTVNQLVKKIVPELKSAGYRFVTIAECLNLGSAYVSSPGPKGPGHC